MTSDLESSLWHETCREQVDAPELVGDTKADLVIVGGGYTGCSAALQAARDGASVCLLEAGECGSGGSGRNVGLANAGLWLPPRQINAQLGEDMGTRLSAILAEAPDVVFGLIDEFDIDCEPVRNGTLHCAHAPGGMADLSNRHGQLVEMGAPVRLLSREEAVDRVGSTEVHGALFDPRAGTIQPLAYARGLARAAAGLGAKLHAGTPAISMDRRDGLWHVTTPQGSVTAKALLMATNAYLRPLRGMKAPSIIHVHFFQGATGPLSDDLRRRILRGGEGCWDTALVMSSWRLDQAGRLIMGAMGKPDHFAGCIHRNWLKRKMKAMFPELDGLAFQNVWHGRIAMTTEHLPKILSLGPDAMACFGYSGRGIGPGTAFGQRLAKVLLGAGEDVLPIRPVRDHSLSLATMRQVYYEAGATLTHFISARASASHQKH